MDKLRDMVFETLRDITSDDFDFEMDCDGEVDEY